MQWLPSLSTHWLCEKCLTFDFEARLSAQNVGRGLCTLLPICCEVRPWDALYISVLVSTFVQGGGGGYGGGGGGVGSGVSHGFWLFHCCLIEGCVQGMSWLTEREIVESWDRDCQWAWTITEDRFDDIWSSQTNKIVMDFLLRFFSCKASYCHCVFCLFCLCFVFLHLELWNFV